MGTVEHTYRQSVDEVYAIVTDVDHLTRRSEDAGHRNVQVTVQTTGDVTTVRLARDIETDIPAFARKVVDAVNHVVDVLEWRASGDKRVGTYHVTISKRISIDGTVEIAARGDGCVFRDTCAPKVDVPFIGKKIASLVERETEKGVRDSLAFTAKVLG